MRCSSRPLKCFFRDESISKQYLKQTLSLPVWKAQKELTAVMLEIREHRMRDMVPSVETGHDSVWVLGYGDLPVNEWCGPVNEVGK